MQGRVPGQTAITVTLVIFAGGGFIIKLIEVYIRQILYNIHIFYYMIAWAKIITILENEHQCRKVAKTFKHPETEKGDRLREVYM